MFLTYSLFSTVFLLFPTIHTTLDGPLGIQDTVDVTGFSKCGMTSRWFRTQFGPFLKNFEAIPRGLDIQYHPLSIGSEVRNGSKIATCENGWLECELNKLQCCSKKYIKDFKSPAHRILTTINCIQGQSTVERALQCLPADYKNLIQKCSKSDEGEKLLLEEPFPHNDSIALPWIKINGIRSWEATQNFQKVLCNLKSMEHLEQCKEKSKKRSG